jgi:D-sedoheptulose 7-phosphate isomerase
MQSTWRPQLVDVGKQVEEYNQLAAFLRSNEWRPAFTKLTELASKAIESRDGLFFMGNGGSAAEATHLAAEFVGKCVVEHEPWPAISLNDSISAITAISNDWSFDEVFARQVRAHAKPNSLFVGLTTSGKSKNILEALKTASSLGCSTALLTSVQGAQYGKEFVDIILAVPSIQTPRIQEVHLFWGHLLAEVLESR